MNNASIIAIAKAIGEKTKQYTNARGEISTGAHEIDITVRIQGGIKVGEDYDQVCAPAADPWGLLAVALSKINGVTLDAIVKEHLDATPERITEIKEQAKGAIAQIKAPTKKPCKGKVTTFLKVTEALIEA